MLDDEIIKETNIIIKQGETFKASITWKDSSGTPVDLTSANARMYLKRSLQGEKLFELTNFNNRIVIEPTNGKLILQISAVDTSTLSGVYYYDLEVVIGDYVKRLIQGKITINPEVTR